jgi:hypothetical protein
MKNRFVIAFLVATLIGFLLVFILTRPLLRTIEFDIRGTKGDEAFSLTILEDRETLIPKTVLAKKNQFQTVSVTQFGSVSGLRLYCMNFLPDGKPRMITILFGSVRVYRKNLLGRVLDSSDWLNSTTIYRSLGGKDLLSHDKVALDGARAGYVGWNGYYELHEN